MFENLEEMIAREMKEQRDNAEKYSREFLRQAKEKYIAWGCEPKCTKSATRHILNIEQIKDCKCPA
jgi:hypothetical protein